MCSSLNPQKSIRIDAELCDGVQAYALAHRLALKPRWFSNFINSAVREKLVREGFLPSDSANSLSDSLRSVRDGFINPEIAKELARVVREDGLVGTSTNGVPSDGSRGVLDGSDGQGVRSFPYVPSGNCADSGVLLGNPINDTSDGSRGVLGGADGQGGDVLDDPKARERIAQSEEPYLAYLVEKHSRADNQANYPRGFDYPQNPAASVLNGDKVGDKAGVPVGCEKPAIVDSLDNCPKTVEVVSESQNREER